MQSSIQLPGSHISIDKHIKFAISSTQISSVDLQIIARVHLSSITRGRCCLITIFRYLYELFLGAQAYAKKLHGVPNTLSIYILCQNDSSSTNYDSTQHNQSCGGAPILLALNTQCTTVLICKQLLELFFFIQHTVYLIYQSFNSLKFHYLLNKYKHPSFGNAIISHWEFEKKIMVKSTARSWVTCRHSQRLAICAASHIYYMEVQLRVYNVDRFRQKGYAPYCISIFYHGLYCNIKYDVYKNMWYFPVGERRNVPIHIVYLGAVVVYKRKEDVLSKYFYLFILP